MFLGVFNTCEIFFLLYNKAKVESSELRRGHLKRLASTALITATNPAELLPKPETEDEFAAYSEAIASVLDSFEGEVAVKACQLLTDLKIDAHYRSLARHRTWYKRGNAIDILSSFRMRDNREFFLAVFRSEPSSDVKYRILYGLSRLTRDHAEIRELAELLSSLPYLTAKYTEDIFFNIISALKAEGREEEFGLFMKESLDDKKVLNLVKRDCITACHAASCEKGRGVLKQYYETHGDEPEIQIAAVKALAKMGDFALIPQALRHADWRVRLTALKYADLCCMELLPEIRGLLRDSSYHVRLAAAMAMARAGGAARDSLREEASSQDKFAAAAAAYALTQDTA